MKNIKIVVLVLLVSAAFSSCTDKFTCVCDVIVYDIDGSIINSFTNTGSSSGVGRAADNFCEDQEDSYWNPPTQIADCYLD